MPTFRERVIMMMQSHRCSDMEAAEIVFNEERDQANEERDRANEERDRANEERHRRLAAEWEKKRQTSCKAEYNQLKHLYSMH